MTALIKLNLL